MVFRVETTAEAELDSISILDWLMAQQAGEAGLRWFLALDDAIASLSAFPERWALAPENERSPFEIRQIVYGRKPHLYRILFTIRGDVVYVLHVRHGRRKRIGDLQ